MRQRALLALLAHINRPVTTGFLTTLVFLLRHETELSGCKTFYDFVPTAQGPYSFGLLREIDLLRKAEYVSIAAEFTIDGSMLELNRPKSAGLADSIAPAVASLVERYGEKDNRELFDVIRERYSGYVFSGGDADRQSFSAVRAQARPAVYTTGYEGYLLTPEECKTKVLLMCALANERADTVKRAIVRSLRPCRSLVDTITAVNGTKFAQHAWFAKRLGAAVYFADPYSSWKRGLSEHTNGLMREHFQKRRRLDGLKSSLIRAVEERINARPRKVLDYNTPKEAFTAACAAA